MEAGRRNPMSKKIREFRSLLKNNLLAFIEASFIELNPETEFSLNWHLEMIAEALLDCFHGRTKRLIINVPPRSLKSHCVSVAFIAWLLGHRPAVQVIVASYAQDLADKHARDCRQLMGSEFYQNAFETRLSMSKAAVNEFMTTEGGTRISTSVGGPMTGRGADFIIIDDPIKPNDALSEPVRNSTNEWFDSTVLSRLNDKKEGCIILIMQRLHEDDLTGHLLESGGWRHLSFPALAEMDEEHLVKDVWGEVRTERRAEGQALHPERESVETLSRLRMTMGDYNFSGQYQQSPAPRGGGLVKIDWLKRFSPSERPSTFDLIFQSWDTANTATTLSDYSACTTWGVKGQRLYLLDVLRKRLEYPELKRVVVSHAAHWNVKNILIENKASGTQLLQELIRAGLHGAKAYKSELEKVVRMNIVTPTMENGFVYIPDEAPWMAEFLHELGSFPKSKHDDQADSLSQALDWFINVHSASCGILEFYERIQAREQASITSIFDAQF